MAGEAILIVDDNEANRRFVEIALAREGYLVRTAANAAEALTAIQGAAPDLILMDLQLPDIDGYELTRRLKTDTARRAIRIVALTAYAMKGDDERARAAGCDGYIAKPVEPAVLRRLVADHLHAAGGPPR